MEKDKLGIVFLVLSLVSVGFTSQNAFGVDFPLVSINDVSMFEGNGPGTTELVFTITVTDFFTDSVTVDYSTAGVTATEGTDYLGGGTSFTIDSDGDGDGVTSALVAIEVFGDTDFEDDETFFVNLSNCVDCTIVDETGQGTILNDDTNPVCNSIFLEDGNSEVGIAPCSPEGVFEWFIAQNLGTTQNPLQVTPNQLDTQWFYIKINDDCDGDCPVSSIDNFFGPPVDVFLNDDNEVTIEYQAEGLSMDVTYTLTGGDIEFGSATLSEVIEITNVNEGDVSFTLYQYSDFDLFGLVGAASDIASFDEESSTVTQTDRARVSETVVSPDPTHWEIDNAEDLLTNIEDGEDLADADTSFGDIAWAFQWDFDLQDGESVTIEKEKSIDQSTPTELHCQLSGESFVSNVDEGLTEIQFNVNGNCLAFVESGEELITVIADGSTAWVTIDEVGEDLFDVTVVYELRGIFGGNPLIVKTFSQMTSDELLDELIDMGIFDDGPGPIPLEVIAGDGAFEGLGGFGTSDFSLEPEFFFQSLLWIVFEDLQIGEGTPYVSMGEFNEMPEHGSVALADFDSGQLFQLGDQIVSSSLSGIAFDEQGRLYVSSIEDEGSRLYEIDPMNGEVIAGGSQFFLDDEQDFFGNGQINDLAYDGINDVLVGIGQVIEGATIGIPGDALFSIDTSTGELTVIGDLDDNLQPFPPSGGVLNDYGGIAFANDGTLLISGIAEGGSFVAEVDITNVVEGTVQFDIPGGMHEVDIFLDGLGVRQSDGQIFGTTNMLDSVHSVDLETGETPTVAGEGTDPDDIAFFPSVSLVVGGTGGEGYEGPTLGEFDNGRLILSNGFCFDRFCLDVLDYFNHLPIQQVDSGTTHTISMTAYCSAGSNRCNYASVGAAPPGTDINSVDWNVILKRTGNSNDWQVTKVDPNGMLGDVTGTVQIVDASRIQYTFNIQFITPASIGTVDGNAEPPEDNMILVTEIRDSNGGVGRNIFNEGVFVNDIYAYPQVDASYLPSVTVAPLCLNEDPTDRNTCAFELVRQWAIKQAEEKLKEIYEQNNYKTD